MSDYGLKQSGFVRKRLDTIIDELSEKLKNDINVDPREMPQSVLSVLTVSFADEISKLWELAEQVYHSQYPCSADGVSLDNALQISGILRKQQTRSKYALSCTGRPGTDIPYGTIVKSTTNPVRSLVCSQNSVISTDDFSEVVLVILGGEPDRIEYTVDAAITYIGITCYRDGESAEEVVYRYQPPNADIQRVTVHEVYEYFSGVLSKTNVGLTTEIITDENGKLKLVLKGNKNYRYKLHYREEWNVSVERVTSEISFEMEQYGDIKLPENSITEIVTFIDGFESVTNALPYTAGRLTETDAELRAEHARRIAVRSQNTIDGICSMILENVSGCSYAVGIENVSDTVDSAGRPPHSFEIIVDGGSGSEIASIIFPNKPAGIATFGNTSSYAIGDFGKMHLVKFSRITDCYLFLTITLYVDDSFRIGDIDIIKNALANKDFEAGKNIKLQSLVNDVLNIVPGVISVNITGKIGATENISSATQPWSYQMVAVGYAHKPRIPFNGINVTPRHY